MMKMATIINIKTRTNCITRKQNTRILSFKKSFLRKVNRTKTIALSPKLNTSENRIDKKVISVDDIETTKHACKDYDEEITTILKCKNYNDGIRKNEESNQELEQQHIRKNKRILVVDDEYGITLAIKVAVEENGFKVDSFNEASKALDVKK
jgi:PleD family two-component response regulator